MDSKTVMSQHHQKTVDTNSNQIPDDIWYETIKTLQGLSESMDAKFRDVRIIESNGSRSRQLIIEFSEPLDTEN